MKFLFAAKGAAAARATRKQDKSPAPPLTPGELRARAARLLGLGALLLLFLLAFSWGPEPGFSMPFERNTLGLRFSLRTQRHPEFAASARGKIALLAIKDSTLQDASLAGKQEYALPRDRHARVVDELVRAGASVIVFDLLFDLPRPEDQIFAAAVEHARRKGCKVIWAAGWRESEGAAHPEGLIRPNQRLLAASPWLGHTRYPKSGDYPLLDRIEQFIWVDGKAIPSLSVAAALAAYEGTDKRDALENQLQSSDSPTFPISYSAAPDLPFANLAYETVYHRTGEEAALRTMNFFRGRIIVIGDTTQLNHDASATPVGEMSGVAIHAQAISTLLSGSWLRYADGRQAVLAILLLLVGGMAVGARLRSWTALSVGGGWLFLYFFVNLLVFCDSGFILPLMAPMLAGLLGVITAMAERSWFLDKKGERLSTLVNQYFSPELAASGAPAGLVTLVFCDIVGSSELSIQHQAQFESARSEYFELLRDCLRRHHGFEVETAGDSQYSVFQRASDAVLFALESQEVLGQHRWPHGIETVQVRIGVHTGRPVIGKDRARLTYRGVDTNKTNRVTATANGGEVVLTREAAEAAGDLAPEIAFETREPVDLKGIGVVETVLARRASTISPPLASSSLPREAVEENHSMLRPETSDVLKELERDTDQLEGATGRRTQPPAESRSSAADAGLDDTPWFEPDLADDSDIDEFGVPREIPMSDLEDRLPASSITSAEHTDFNAPGEIDIEELDEGDLDGTNLPPDARLDPLEP